MVKIDSDRKIRQVRNCLIYGISNKNIKNFDAISLIKIKKTPIIRHQRQAL